ncbi:2-oxo acid dehydrogenase subunit E2 [Aidingimonas halophila]|uniref:Dihydrolipoamide acetyltransferase component of pyruvate dehydrogenase complex n=1 Tax=Aidingimonas halophila TaxID=574349 RepID=A0A1H3BD39_9GAMM|nr:2-oxo acid dehydrogenase subunit E2 [Aidingimonas halophila]GHC26291.1 dihydrolipoamide acetyltransferase component of pyruvate dehydrogenase complex [Aidingimonas halophila]SDX39725.1 2-oxoisovalerate dehydrogenase E2 component (dihydrolipoyl transacylase) [Aidingimonas halophila]
MSDFILPDIGEGIVECELVKWLVAEGDRVEEDQPVVEVMTDKALVEIPAPATGRIARLYYREGDVAKVDSPLFAWEESDASGVEPTSENDADEPVSAARESRADTIPANESISSSPHRQRTPASPAVRRLVREHGLNLDTIAGSGKDGRVLKEDVLACLETDEQVTAQVEPMTGIRSVMARHMEAAARTIPHFVYGDEVDVTELLTVYERLKSGAERAGIRLTLMALFMKSLALAIREHPLINARLNEDASEIHYQPACHIGMAVDSENGLVVPNVKHAERLTLLEIAAEIARLTEDARQGRLARADLQGGTISMSNIGVLGGTYAAPIINAPEVAIVALGRIQWLPRFDVQNNVVSRAIMTVSWAGDHRVLDGGTMARFCNDWKSYLESPETMLLHMG